MVEKLKIPRALVGKWTHAHERDQAGVRVFVGPAVRLGLSRGRRVLELDREGGFVDHRPGPDDRTGSGTGRYRVEGDELVLEHEDGRRERMRFELSTDGELRLMR